jgi:hypothetical protein
MSDTILSLAVPSILILVLVAWAPLLRGAEALSKRHSRRFVEEVPDLREDDTSPQLTRETA